jgi:hypothetical protein
MSSVTVPSIPEASNQPKVYVKGSGNRVKVPFTEVTLTDSLGRAGGTRLALETRPVG